MYIIICEMNRQYRCSGLVHCDDPGGWDGEGDGGWVLDGETCVPMADLCQCMAKTTTIL